MKIFKLNRENLINVGFVIGLIIFTVIALNLPVNWFVIVMPIVTALIFAAILFSKSE